MSASYCRECHQPIYDTRVGVRLPKIKAKIFDLIRSSGERGVRVERIIGIVFNGESNNVNVRNHVHQINRYLADTGLQIYGDWPNRGYYRLAGVNREIARVTL
jgi:hypothetical protein